jgi:hypothetical protein
MHTPIEPQTLYFCYYMPLYSNPLVILFKVGCQLSTFYYCSQKTAHFDNLVCNILSQEVNIDRGLAWKDLWLVQSVTCRRSSSPSHWGNHHCNGFVEIACLGPRNYQEGFTWEGLLWGIAISGQIRKKRIFHDKCQSLGTKAAVIGHSMQSYSIVGNVLDGWSFRSEKRYEFEERSRVNRS